jgi:nucleotide-binding universal stress UspA family protein
MPYKDILVYLDPTDDARERLRLAISMAHAHGARLTGVDASTDAAFAAPWIARAQRIDEDFEAATAAAGLEHRFVGANAALTVGAEYGHCVDLTIAPRPEGEARALIRSEIPDEALIASGAPMLILPQDWKPTTVGERIVIAWNASREATHSVHAALPLLIRAKKVTIFTFSPRASALRGASEMLADHLKRHGVSAQISDWTNTGDISALEALFASLDTQDADLIVAGAYGHSRLFENMFGGVSVDLMRQPTVPILMSH